MIFREPGPYDGQMRIQWTGQFFIGQPVRERSEVFTLGCIFRKVGLIESHSFSFAYSIFGFVGELPRGQKNILASFKMPCCQGTRCVIPDECSNRRKLSRYHW